MGYNMRGTNVFANMNHNISDNKYIEEIGGKRSFNYNFNSKIPFNSNEILLKLLYENNVKRSFRYSNSKSIKMVCWAIDKSGRILSKGIADNTSTTFNSQFYSIHKELKHNGKHAEMEMIFGLRARNNNTEYTCRIHIPKDLDINMGRTTFSDDIDIKKFKQLKYIDTKHIFINKNNVDSILIARLTKKKNINRKEVKLGWCLKTSTLGDCEPCAACYLNLLSYFKGTNTKLIYLKNDIWTTKIL